MSNKKQVYDNYEIYNMDGTTFLAYCDKGKFNWYLKKNLAVQTGEKSIKLLFSVKNNNNKEIKKNKKENICYVCDDKNNLTKYHVIPSEYKKHMPVEFKSHNSLDILPLCQDCKSTASSESENFKRELGYEYNISPDKFIDYDKVELKYLARKINKIKNINKNNKYLIESISNMEEILGRKITDDDLKNYEKIKINKTYEDSKTPGEYIVKKIISENKLSDFVKRWKDHFITTMNPIHLPENFYDEKN